MAICANCQESFEPKDHYKKQKYCSYKCARFARRVIEWPDKKTLYDLVHSKPIAAIGRLYGVSVCTVTRWVDHHGIEVPKPEKIKKIIYCKQCGKKILRKRLIQKYCSLDCSSEAKLAINPQPSREELEILGAKMTNKELAEKYGVSTTTIHAMYKRHGVQKQAIKK